MLNRYLLYVFFSFGIVMFNLFAACSQGIKYKPVPDLLSTKIQFTLVEIPIDAYPIEKSLPSGFSTNGNTDYTSYVQKALNEHAVIVFPNFPVLINDNGLYIQSNCKIYFKANSKIIAKPSKVPKTDVKNIKDWYDIIRIYNKQNIEVYNANVIGDRKKHKGVLGQWGAGIGIRNSSNIKILNATIKQTWGDGIFIGSEDGGVCKTVFLTNIVIDEARRNGISITSGKDIHLKNVLISNTWGTAPQYGLDIEPSWYKDDIENIDIDNIYTFNNLGGISINTSTFESNDKDYKKDIYVTIKNHYDEGSKYPFGTSINSWNRRFLPHGKIIIENAYWKNNSTTNYFFATKNKFDLTLELKNIKVENSGRNVSNSFLQQIKAKPNVQIQ